MGRPKISDKRWSVDLEKRIQEEHYDEESYHKRYGFNKETDKEIFVIDTPPPYPPVEHGTLELLPSTA